MVHDGGALRRGLRRLVHGGMPARPAAEPHRGAPTNGAPHPVAGVAPAAPPTEPGLVLTEEFTRALALLEAGRHVFITGRAGTGKSTLVRHFLATTGRTVTVAAPTGIAALNVGGYTIHRLFSFHPGTTHAEVSGGSYYPARFAETLRGIDTLVIDEASMVRADLFDLLEAALRRYGPRRGEPFGGVQLVLVGDLFQLPPVVMPEENEYFTTRYPSPYFFAADTYDPADFPVVALTRVFRQQGDTELVDVLNAVRSGALLDDARARLNTRTRPEFEPPLDQLWLTLTTTNRIAGARNRRMLERLPGPVHSYDATVAGETDGFEPPVEEHLQLAAGAQVMLLNNDPGGRWVNGTLGRIENLDIDADGEPVAWVRDQDGERLAVRRHTWDITRPVIEGRVLRHEVVGRYTQLPIKLAWAITIHKSQGQTLDRVVVDLSGGTFTTGQLYVALSRCTSMSGLVLHRDVLPKDLRSDMRVRRFLAENTESPEARGHAYLGILTVGDEDRMSRPRPIELAVVTDDGEEVTTLVNPACDLYDARTRYDLTVADIQFAPVLSEAWAALRPVLAGRIPVAVDVDRIHGLIDFELKRLGVVAPLPTGLVLDPSDLLPAEAAALAAPTAIERARASCAVSNRLGAGTARGEPYSAPGEDLTGYLLPRGPWPGALAAPAGHPDPARTLAEHLRTAAARAHLDAAALDRLRAAEEHLGRPILDPEAAARVVVDPAAALLPGVRICFTGTVVTADGRRLERPEMEAIATAAGFAPVANMTKTKCDLLVVAEAGTQSSKAKKALEYGKPIITAEEFLAHVAD